MARKTRKNEIEKPIIKEAYLLIANLVRAAEKAHQNGEEVLIAIETTWIPEEQKTMITGLINAISSLSGKNGLDNVHFISRDGPELADDIEKRKKQVDDQRRQGDPT